MNRELQNVEAKLESLERAVSEIVFDARSQQSLRFHELQEIDRVRQEVAGIAKFLGSVALDAPAEWTVDARAASRAVRLEALAVALRRGETVASQHVGEYEPID